MRWLAAGLAMALLAGPAGASELLETYFARLGPADHFNSRGERLRDIAAIIRQDRANFHAFGIRDEDDQGDRFFADKANRGRLEQMLRNGRVSPAARHAILNETPIIYVEVYDDWIEVDVQ